MGFKHPSAGYADANPVASGDTKPASPPSTEMTLLEPRILLDASLGWSVDAADLAVTLDGIAYAIDQQHDAFTAFIDSLASDMDTAAAAFDAILGTDAAGDTAAYIDEIVARLTAAADELQESALDLITDLFDTSDTAVLNDIRARFLTGLQAAADDAFSQGEIDALNAVMTNARLATLFSTDTFSSGGLQAGLTALAADMAGTLGTAGVTATEAFNALLGATNDRISTVNGGLTLAIDLNDIAGSALAFAQVGGAAQVTIDLDGLGANFDALFAAAMPSSSLAGDLSLAAVAGQISFEITSTVDTSGGNLNGISLDVDTFDFGALMSIGGSIAVPTDPMTIGMVDLTVQSIDTASLGLFLGGDVIDLGLSVDLTGAAPAVTLNDPSLVFTVEARISEAGDSSGTFTAIEADQAYDILALTFGGSFDFVTGLGDTDASDDNKTFDASLVISAVLDSSAATDASSRLAALIGSAEVGSFSVDFSGSVSDAALASTLETVVESLLVMRPENAVTFFNDFGLAMRAILESAIFDTTIPFTDIELSSVTQAIANIFSTLGSAFVYDAADLGFPADQGRLSLEVNGELTAATGLPVSDTQFDDLRDIDILHLRVLTGAVDAEGVGVNVPVNIDLGANAVFSDPTSTNEELLDELVALLNAALGSYDLVAAAVNGALRITANNPGGDPNAPLRSFSLVGATRKDTSLDDDYGLEDLGFTVDDLSTIQDALQIDPTSDPVLALGEGTESALNLKHTSSPTLTFGSNFETMVTGVESLRFVVTMHGLTQNIDIPEPAGGWMSGAVPNYAGVATEIQDAFDRLGVPMSITGGAGGLSFATDPGTDFPVRFGVASQILTKAVTLDGMIGYVNAVLNQSGSIFEGAEFVLTEAGELIFAFPDASATGTVGTGDAVSLLSTEGLGLGELTNLSLEAKLSATFSAHFSGAAGIDLVGMASAIIAAAGGTNAVDADADAATVLDAMLDNVFFQDIALAAQFTGSATDVTGSASLGMVEVELGADDASNNWLAIDTQINVTLVGSNDADGYNNQITFANIIEAIQTSGNSSAAGGFRALVGQFDIQGGIVTDGDGNPLNASGNPATDSTYRIEDVTSYTPASGEELVEFVASFGDVKLNVAGIQGLTEGLVEGVNLSISDIFNPLDTFDYSLLSSNQAALDAIDALSMLGEGDILDSLSAIANMLVVAGDTLKDKLPFLALDIPLLNFSLLDSIDFARDFIDGLREVRDNPQGALDKIDAMLEEVFGADTVTLTWDGDAKTIIFGLSFKFLDDYSEELPFALDLKELVGSSLTDILGETVANLITGLVDVSGDGTMVFDPNLSLDFVFGIDLSPTLVEPTVPATLTLPLEDLGTVSDIIGATDGGNDLKIVWNDVTAGTTASVEVDLSGAETLGDAVTLINTAITTAFGSNVTFTFDAASQTLTFSDSNAHTIDETGVTALFGAATATSTAGSIVLGGTGIDFAGAYSFELVIGAGGETVVVDVAADAGRTTAADLADAINDALDDLAVSRRTISDTAGPLLGIAVSQLLTAEIVGSDIALVATNFADAVGYDAYSFSVQGVDTSHDVRFTLIELDGSNAARMLGFDTVGTPISGDAVSDELWEATSASAPRVYLDTDASGIRLDLSAGVADGLNLAVGFGPLTVNVVDGHALLTSADGTGPAYIALGINDIDGDGNAGQFDLSHIFDISSSGQSFADLFALDVSIGVSVDLPFADSVGIFNPADHGISYNATLIETLPGTSFSDIDTLGILGVFEGDIISLFNGDSIDTSNLVVSLPDLSDFFSNFNYLAFLNDPRAVLDGLDMILDRMQFLFDEYLSQIEMPVVGDAIGAGVTFFADFRYNVIEKIRVLAETPKADGTYPTTIDLLTDAFNGLLNDLFTPGQNVQYLQAALITDGAPEDSYLVGALNFSGVIFDEMMNIAFDFGIPGLDLDVEDGSEIRMILDYSVNLGFGLDKRGFFLLNDTTDPEVKIQFTADAGSFVGSATVLNTLGLKADAVTLDENGDIVSGLGDNTGTAMVSAYLGADLFGATGLEIVSGTAGTDQIQRDLSDLTLQDGTGGTLDFERLVYISSLDAGNLIAFTFGAEFDIQISLEGSILNPLTGDPVEVGGYQVIPTVATEVWIKGEYTREDGMVLEKLEFDNVRIDASELYEAIIKPVLDPIMGVVSPLADYFGWLEDEPFSYAIEPLKAYFPILGIVTTVLDVIDAVEDFQASGGTVNFGDFVFISETSGGDTSGETKLADSSPERRPSSTSSAIPDFGGKGSGISIDIPLITDPMNALNLILGKFDQVDLIDINMYLFDIDTGRINVGDLILDSFGAPGWVKSIISSAFEAYFSLKFKAGFSAGYDLGGIVNFVNTLDPIRLLDGVFIDSAPGSLVTAEVSADVSLNAGLAGLDGSVGAGVHLSLNDPNRDGKLRIPELIAMIEEAAGSSVSNALGIMFYGDAYVHASLSIWAGINLPWPLPDLKFSVDLFDINESINFGGTQIEPRIVTDLDNGETAFLNVGSRYGDSMSRIVEDGDDRITVSGSAASNYQVNVAQGSQSLPQADIEPNPSAIVTQAGEGNNTVDLSGITDGTPTVTFAGAGTDTITLPPSGIHVIFAGEGNDTISAPAGSTGTYIIFGEKGSDTVNIPGGNVLYFGDTDFGMRDLFLATFASGGINEGEIRDFFGIDGDSNPLPTGAANYTLNGDKLNLADLLDRVTLETQLTAGKNVETVNIGAGNHTVVTGGGADKVTVTGTASTGEMRFYLGGANDDLLITGGAEHVFVEAGAGGDRVFVEADASEIWGWGKVAGIDGLIGTEAGRDIDALAIRDGSDVLVGGSGNDLIYGQLDNDVIQGGMGADSAEGGLGKDLITGGTFVLTDGNGNSIAIEDFSASAPSQSGVILSAVDAADGNDVLGGGAADDIIIGGGGNDTVLGGTGNDVVLGDFGQVGVSSNLVAETVVTEFDESDNAGTDSVEGGAGNDIIIVGGGLAGEVETVVDTEGSNVVIGDFGTASGTRLLDAVTYIEAYTSSKGSDDAITTGAGNDMIVGGEGSDIIISGAGGDIILTDIGTIDILQGIITGVANVNSGDDQVTTAADDDLIDIMITGQGSDTVTGGLGGLIILSDNGTIQLDETALGLLRDYVPPGPDATQEELDKDAEILDRIRQVAELLTTNSSADDGDDDITALGGTLIAALGGGADHGENTGADGAIYVLGDDGTIEMTGTGPILTGQAGSFSGADTLESGAGGSYVVGGEGGDTVVILGGNNKVLGDLGVMSEGDMTSADPLIGGDDTITTGAGDDTIFGQAGSDLIDAGDGNNVVLGDNGSYDGTTLQTETGSGAADDITTGAGNDLVIGQTGGDTIASGGGDDLVMGDFGTITRPVGTGTGTMTSLVGEAPANDSINAGDGNDLVIAGQGDDYVETGNGDDVVAGDSAEIVYEGTASIISLTITDDERGGADTLTAEGTEGDNVLLGQFGADSLIGGTEDDVMLGDLATLTFLPPANAFPGQSSGDRVNNITAVRPDIGFDDTITGGDGTDFVMGGMGADLIHGDGGDDLLIGDNVIMNRIWTPIGGPAIFEEMTLDTNFAFVTGGDDTIFGDEGADLMIGGLGPDLFHGDTQRDLIFSDAYAGIFNATWPFGFDGPTPKRELITSNFAGPGPIDIVSDAQMTSSIGANLNFTEKYTDVGTSDTETLSLLGVLSSSNDLLGKLSAFLAHNQIVHSIALMLLAGADKDLIIAALRAELASSLTAAGRSDLLAQQVLIDALLERYLEKAGVTETAAADETVVGDDTELAYQIAAE